jgi:hypothetical protein
MGGLVQPQSRQRQIWPPPQSVTPASFDTLAAFDMPIPRGDFLTFG